MVSYSGRGLPSESSPSAFLVVVADAVVDCLDDLAWCEMGGPVGLFLEAAPEAPDRRVIPAAGPAAHGLPYPEFGEFVAVCARGVVDALVAADSWPVSHVLFPELVEGIEDCVLSS